MLHDRQSPLRNLALCVLLGGIAFAIWLVWSEPGDVAAPLPPSSTAAAPAETSESLSPPRTLLLARNTAVLALGACAIALPLGTVLALLLVRTDTPGRRIAMVLLGVSLFMPLYLQAAAWESGFGRLGWYSIVSQSLAAPWLTGMRAAIWIHGLAAVPWVALIVGAGLRLVEPELEEEALIDGSAAQVFFNITLRRTASALAVAALWIIVVVAGEMTVTDIYLVRTYAEELYTGFALGDTLGEAWGAALPMMALVAWLTVAALVTAAALAPPHRAAPVRPPWTFRLGVFRWPAAVLVWLTLLLIVGLPLANLVGKAGFVAEETNGQFHRYWSLAQFHEMTTGSFEEYQTDMRGSLLLGMATASVVLLLAAPLAWRARRGGVHALPALLVAALCLAAPGPLVGLGINWLFTRPFVPFWLYDNTLAAPMLALGIRAAPLTILVCWHALRSVSDEVLEAAQTEGAGPWSRWLRIALPQRAAALGAAWLVAFAVAVGDLAASILAMPPAYDVVSVRIWGLIHFGVEQKMAGLCLASVALFALIGAAAIWLFRQAERSQ